MFLITREQTVALTRDYRVREFVAGLEGHGLTSTLLPDGETLRLRDGAGRELTVHLDAEGRPTEVRTALGRVCRYAWDAQNRLSRWRSPGGGTREFRYDEHGQIVGTRRDGVHEVQFDWDGRAIPRGVREPDGAVTRTEGDARGELARVVDARGGVVTLERDAHGRTTVLRTPMGAEHRIGYSTWDRPDTIVFPDGTVESYERDAHGRVTRVSRDGVAIAAYAWDTAGRLARVDCADGYWAAYEYDAAGRITRACNPWHDVLLQYDGRGQLAAETCDGETVRLAWNAAGQLEVMEWPDGTRAQFARDADARLERVDAWGSAAIAWRYDAHDRATAEHRDNGVTMRAALGPSGAVDALTLTDARGGALWDETYTYDGCDRMVTRSTAAGGHWAYRYDREGALVEVAAETPTWRERFGFDADGNRVGVDGARVAVDAGGRLRHVAGIDVTHDRAGNLVRLAVADAATTCAFNLAGLLTAVRLPNGETVDCTYDALGRRRTKVTRRGRTTFTWAGPWLVRERCVEGAHARLHDWLWDPDRQTLLATRADGVVLHAHTDARGVPRALTDARGQLAWTATLSAFGELRAEAGTAWQPWRFAGHYHDRETGLHYNFARYYAPRLGQYLSRDPFWPLSGEHPYAYCDYDPVNRCDPLGLLWGRLARAVGGALIATAGAAVLIVAAPVIVAAAAATLTVAACAAAVATVALGAGLFVAGVYLAFGPSDCNLRCALHRLASGFVRGANEGAGLAGREVMGQAMGQGMGGGGPMAGPSPVPIGPSPVLAPPAAIPVVGAPVPTILQMGRGDRGRDSAPQGSRQGQPGGEPPRSSEPGLRGIDRVIEQADRALARDNLSPADRAEVQALREQADTMNELYRTRQLSPGDAFRGVEGASQRIEELAPGTNRPPNDLRPELTGDPLAPSGNAGHSTGGRGSTAETHEAGDTRRGRDRGGEAGDERRDYPRRPPANWRGPWPPPSRE